MTRSLYTLNPLFEAQKRFFKEGLLEIFRLYVWLVFKSGLYSRAGYDGPHMVSCKKNTFHRGFQPIVTTYF